MNLLQNNKQRSDSAKNLVTQGSILVAATFLVRLMNVFYRIPVTNLWGDHGLGTYGDAYQVYSFFLVFSSMAIPTTLSKLLGERFATGRWKDAKKVVKCALILVGGIGFVSMMIMLLFSEQIAMLYHNPEVARPIRFLGPTLFIVSLRSILRGYFQGLNNMKPTAISELIDGFLHAVFAVVLAYVLFNAGGMAWSVTGGILGTLIGSIGGAVFLVFCYYIYRGMSIAKEKETPQETEPESDKQIYGEILKLMIPIVLASSAFSIKGILDASMFGGLMMAEGYNPELAVAMRGIYTGKFVVLINLPIAIGDSLGSAAVPAVAASFAQNKMDELEQEFYTLIKTILIVAIPCAVGLMTLGKPVLKMMFAHSPLGGELFWVGSFSVVFYCLNYAASGVLQGMNKQQYPMIHTIIGVVFSCILNCVTVRVLHLGIYSLAINSALFSFFIMVLNLSAAMKFCNVKIDFWKLSKGPILCSALMAVVCVIVYLLLFAITGSNAASVIGAVLAGIVSYFTFMVNFKGMTTRDMHNLPGGKYLEKLRLK